MNIISGLSLKSLTNLGRLLIVLSLLIGLFVPLSLAQAGAEPGDPTVNFTVSDTAICMPEPGLIEAALVVSIPGGGSGKLETDWYISKPLTGSPVHHYATVMVNDGDEISFSGVWPGVNPGDDVVEIHFGASLKVNYALVDTASLDYYWYPWVCEIDPTPTPTTPTPTEPTPTEPLLPSQLRPSRLRLSRHQPSQLRPSQLRPSQLRPSQLRPSQLRPSQLRLSQLRLSQLQPSQLQPSQLQPRRLPRQPHRLRLSLHLLQPHRLPRQLMMNGIKVRFTSSRVAVAIAMKLPHRCVMVLTAKI